MCLFKDFCSPNQHCVSRNFVYTFFQCGPLVHCCCWYKSYKYQQNTPAHHSHLPPHSRRKTSRKIKTFSPFLLISQQKSRLKPSVLVGLLAPPVSPQDLPWFPPVRKCRLLPPRPAPASCSSAATRQMCSAASGRLLSVTERGGNISISKILFSSKMRHFI